MQTKAISRNVNEKAPVRRVMQLAVAVLLVIHLLTRQLMVRMTQNRHFTSAFWPSRKAETRWKTVRNAKEMKIR